MKLFFNLIKTLRWYILILTIAITVYFAMTLKNIAFEGSYRIWFGEQSKTLTDYDRFRDIFGNDDSVIISFSDEKGIFTKKALRSIGRLTDELWKTKYIARVDSLTSYQHISVDEKYPDEIQIQELVKDYKFRSKNDIYFQIQRYEAIHDQDIVDFLISKDGKTTMIVAKMTAKAGESEDISLELMGILNKMLEKESALSGYKYWVNGGAALTSSFVELAQSDGGFFTPLVVTCVMLILFLLFRKLSGVLIPMSAVIVSIIIVLAIQVLLGYKLNNFTANIPVFIIAITIADAVHIYIVWMMYKKDGKDNDEAVFLALKKNFMPVFLTSFTTAVGFSSLMISEIVPVATLGMATASGAVLAFILSITLVPALLLIFGKKVHFKAKKDELSLNDADKFAGYSKYIIKNDKKIIYMTGLLFIILSAGLFFVKVDSNTIRYFDEDVEIRKSTQFLMDNITGPMVYEIVVDSNQKDGIKEPAFLQTVNLFYDDLRAKYSDVRHLSSLLNVVKKFNQVMHQNKERWYKVPQTKEEIAQYLLLYSLSMPQGMDINDKMDINQKLLRVSAQVNMVDTSIDLEMMQWIEDWWLPTPYSAHVNGQASMFAHMQKDVTNTLIYSISIVFVLITIMFLIIFRSFKLLPILMLPNLLPIALVIGLMGWLSIKVDLGIAIAVAIILGVAVDDSIHFFIKYFDARKKGMDIEKALAYVLRYAGSAIVFTTIILTVSFSLFVFSDFLPNYNFGIVTASALIIALIADILFLPAMLSVLEKRNYDKINQ